MTRSPPAARPPSRLPRPPSRAAMEDAGQCERNPACTRGFKHRGLGGHCRVPSGSAAAARTKAGKCPVVGRSSGQPHESTSWELFSGDVCLWRDGDGRWAPGRVTQLRFGVVLVEPAGEELSSPQRGTWLGIDAGRIAPLARIYAVSEARATADTLPPLLCDGCAAPALSWSLPALLAVANPSPPSPHTLTHSPLLLITSRGLHCRAWYK